MIQKTLEFTDEEKRRAMNKTDRIEQILKAGTTSSVELLKVTHRFSACIQNLRDRGYEIVVEKLEDGTSLHTVVGYVPRIEVTEDLKQAYYDTLHWAELRLDRMRFDDFHCCHCRSRDDLQVHHWVYELFAESLEDLVTLCRTCHTRIHAYDCVKAHFPKYVIPEIASKCTSQHVAEAAR